MVIFAFCGWSLDHVTTFPPRAVACTVDALSEIFAACALKERLNGLGHLSSTHAVSLDRAGGKYYSL